MLIVFLLLFDISNIIIIIIIIVIWSFKHTVEKFFCFTEAPQD